MKHATTPQARRSKRLQTDLSEGRPSSVVELLRCLGSKLDMEELKRYKEDKKRCSSTCRPSQVPFPRLSHKPSRPQWLCTKPASPVQQCPHQVVQIEVLSYTTGTIDQAPLTAVIGAYNQPSQPFYSIAVNFGSRER